MTHPCSLAQCPLQQLPLIRKMPLYLQLILNFTLPFLILLSGFHPWLHIRIARELLKCQDTHAQAPLPENPFKLVQGGALASLVFHNFQTDSGKEPLLIYGSSVFSTLVKNHLWN